jgi:hypothetical protein
MVIANTDSTIAFKLLLSLNSPKLTPLFQVSTRLKKDVIGTTFGGCITASRIHHFVA